MELVEEIYLLTKKLPSDERFGLCSQIRRAAVSIPSNVSEGHRRSTKEFIRFLTIADGSAAEVETQLILIAKIYPSIDCAKSFSLLSEVQKMIWSMSKGLKLSAPR